MRRKLSILIKQIASSDISKNIKKVVSRAQTIGEEIANAISHGVGTMLSIAGMIILIITPFGPHRGLYNWMELFL